MLIAQDIFVKLGLHLEVFAFDPNTLMPTIDQRNITSLKFFFLMGLKFWVFGVIFPMRNEHKNHPYLNDRNFV